MKSTGRNIAVETRAAGVLKGLLEQVSAVRVREIRTAPRAAGRSRALFASIDVLGRPHTLACAIASAATPSHIGEALSELRRGVSAESRAATPVLIAPRLPRSARAMYQSTKVGFVDFQGNAHLELGEVFIWKRSLRQRRAHPEVLLGP